MPHQAVAPSRVNLQHEACLPPTARRRRWSNWPEKESERAAEEY